MKAFARRSSRSGATAIREKTTACGLARAFQFLFPFLHNMPMCIPRNAVIGGEGMMYAGCGSC